MLALVQACGLEAPGGGPRILSSLVRGSAYPFVSISTGPLPPPLASSGVEELHVPQRRAFSRLERGRIGSALSLIDLAMGRRLAGRLHDIFCQRGVKAVHTIPHAPDFWPAYRAARQTGARFALSAHDDIRYIHARSPALGTLERSLAEVWCDADIRFAISEEIGEEYSRRFGERDFVVLTDGVDNVAPFAKARAPESLHVHFGGSIHSSYSPNFTQLVEALRRVKAERPNWDVSLTLRGGSLGRPSPGVDVQVLPWADQVTFEQDLRRADLLYLPLPFEERYLSLSRFSLSTKMVSYLASGTPILYHGPGNAAAGRLLAEKTAALCVTEPQADRLIRCLLVPACTAALIAENGLVLAKKKFDISYQRAVFWNSIFPATESRQTGRSGN